MADLEKLDKAIKELEIQSNDLKDFNKVYSEIGKLRDDISKSLSLLKENNDDLSAISTEVKTRLEDSKKHFESLESKLFKKIQEIYEDSRKFQKELDTTLFNRLELHNSNIQDKIKKESTKIREGFENTLDTNFNLMESKLKELFDVQSKQINLLKILMFVSLGIGIGLSIGLYLK